MAESSSGENLPEIERGSPPLAGERVSCTGTLASMTHRQAHELVETHGGSATTHVSQQTTMLVVGEEGWPLEPDGQPSQKLQQVTEWNRQGHEIRVLAESDWLHLLGLADRREEVHRLYTPAMLSQLLHVPVGAIRGWERRGLIKAVRRVYRLPYFDFQEVTSARRVSELLEQGVSRTELEASLRKLNGVLQGIDQPLAQLDILARDTHLVYRDEAGLVEPASGQRVFDFDPPAAPSQSDDDEENDGASSPSRDVRAHWTAEDWLREGCRLLEQHAPDAAIEAFRLCLMDRPGDAELNFFLAEALYRAGNRNAALERYYAAVESDHDYIEAWTQLGCVHAERGQFEPALEAYRIAIDLHADYPDAHWHAADALCELGREQEAVVHWRKYLEFDSRGPWAAQARQRLEEAGAVEAANVE